MSRENVDDLVRRYIEAFNEGGLEAIEAFHDPDVVFDLSRSPFPDAGVYGGREGIRDWFDGLACVRRRGVCGREACVLREQVAVLVHIGGLGPGSGIPVDYHFAPVFTFHDGRVVRMDRFADWAEAVEAVGLRE